jgi:hypothetical protein
MKYGVVVLLASGVLAGLAFGGQGEVKGKGDKKDGKFGEKTYKEITLVGRIVKDEKKNDEGTVVKTFYSLVDAVGKETRLPPPRPPNEKDQAPDIALDEYVGANVKLLVQGFDVEKNNVRFFAVHRIASIEKTAEP